MARIFIGSSSESLEIAKIIKIFFSKDYECVIWTDSFFELNQNTYDNLCKKALAFDYAIFVGGIDDAVLRIRDKTDKLAIRDNIYFEYGLYVGTLSKERIFFLVNEKVSIASDFLGVTLLYYKESNDIENHCKSIKNKIVEEERINRIQLLPSTSLAYDYNMNFLKPLSKCLGNNYLWLRFKRVREKKIQILIPKDNCGSLKDYADSVYRSRNIKHHGFVLDTKRITVKYDTTALRKRKVLLIIDIPMILEASYWTIEKKLEINHVGDTPLIKSVRKKETDNFIKTLNNLIKDDLILSKCVEIIHNIP